MKPHMRVNGKPATRRAKARLAGCWALAFLCGLSALPCRSVDTAFWHPYETDEKTWLLEHFEGVAGAVDEGRFGNGWRGPQPYVWTDAPVLAAGVASLEGWVKLDALPEQRAYVIRRRAEPGATRALELFVEPDGALGMAISDLSGRRAELLSQAGAVQPGAWRHLAGICADAFALYVDGRPVGRRNIRAGSPGLTSHEVETASAPVYVAEGLPGLVDEIRVHTYVMKFWPEPEHPWLARLAEEGLAPDDAVFRDDVRPVLHLPLNGAFGGGPADHVEISGEGHFVDGIRGQAFSGTLNLRGRLAGAEAGSIEFWSRPRGYGNLTDQNRSILHTSLFNFYFWNSSHGLRPVTLYYRDPENQLVFAGDTLGTEIYSGQWYHYVIAWDNGRVAWYVNGRKAATQRADFKADGLTSLRFGMHGFGDVDEVFIYDVGLTETEARNVYWRYVDPGKLVEARPRIADLKFWHLPSERTLYAEMTPVAEETADEPVTLLLQDPTGRTVFRQDAALRPGMQTFTLPELDGEYRISVRVGDRQSQPQVFKRRRFDWEGNELGITDEVFPPFEPIETGGPQNERVTLVQRAFVMNAFGLWDRVTSLGKDILAAPVRLAARDADGRELAWEGTVGCAAAQPALAVYRAQSRSPAVRIEAVSELEMDGMMKVTLRLLPVENPVPLQRLTLEIPLRADVATLMQEVGNGPRTGYTGLIPAGAGVVWDSRQTIRSPAWLNAFTSYIWLGGAERGLCWFAENDKGWKTAKTHDQPLQRIVRRAEAVVLEVDLVNVSGPVTNASELCFGLQVSPTKPVPPDIARKGDTLPNVGLPVHPWGGLSCSWKSPWQDRWEVVDKVIEARAGKPPDTEFFDRFVEQYDPPPVHGKRPWREDINIFLRPQPPGAPDPVYFEELAVLPFIPEYHVFQDEWSLHRLADKRYSSVDVYRETGGREINPRARINFCRSYQDYALNLMNEWWKRGVSIYWDNTYPRLTDNPWTSAAYRTADGRIQPARVYWNARQYFKRTWNLMHAWRRRGVARPLEFVAHMTNCNVLPFFTWATCNYDMELSQGIYAKTHPEHYTPGEPFTPAYLRSTSTGRQVGNYPYLVHDLFQSSLPAAAWGLGDEQSERALRSWGMRTVHQIISGGVGAFPVYNKTLAAFGYGTEGVATRLYWEDEPAFTVDRDEVKGLLLTRAADRQALLVLQSWSKEPVQATVRFDPARIGFVPGPRAYEGLNNQAAALADGNLPVAFDFPYETRIYLLGVPGQPSTVLFADDFEAWLHPGWDYLSSFAAIEDGWLRLGRNATSWQGPPRLFKYLDLPDFTEGALSFRFRVETVPDGKASVLTAAFGKGLNWSRHGLTHGSLDTDVQFDVTADPGQGWVWQARARRNGKHQSLAAGTVAGLDTAAHRVRITVEPGGRTRLRMDGTDVLSFEDVDTGVKSGFMLVTSRNPADTIGALYLDDVVLESATPDRAALEQARAAARAQSREVVSAQVDELKRDIVAAFGVFGSNDVYALAMFRRPEVDAATVVERIRTEDRRDRLVVLLKVLQELPKRQAEHVAGMQAIGQTPHRLDEFRRARRQAVEALRDWQTAVAGEEREATLDALRRD